MNLMGVEIVWMDIVGALLQGAVATYLQCFLLKAYGKDCPEYKKRNAGRIAGMFLYNTAAFFVSGSYRIMMEGRYIAFLMLYFFILFLGVTAYMDGSAGHFELSVLLLSYVVLTALLLAYLLSVLLQIRSGACAYTFTAERLQSGFRLLILVFFILAGGKTVYTKGDGAVLIQVLAVFFVLNTGRCFFSFVLSMVCACFLLVCTALPRVIRERNLRIQAPFVPCIAVGSLVGVYLTGGFF